jgi:predicted dienelactone hydrolase
MVARAGTTLSCALTRERVLPKYHWICVGLALLNARCQPLSDAAGEARLADSAIVAAQTGLRCEDDARSRGQTDYGQPGPHQVGVLDVSFEDRARPINANAKHDAAPSRTLTTSIYYPARGSASLLGAPPLAVGGPFPLLMYSHGYGSNRGEAQHLGERAASHGYVLVAVDFPFTNTDRLLSGARLDTSDIGNQAGDQTFLIDQLLALSHDPRHVLSEAVDAARIGATGVSMGGLTTLLLAFHPRLQDPRIRAAAPIAPLSSFFLPQFYHTRELPLLVISGDLDAFIDYDLNARRSFERSSPNARLVTLAKGTHAAFAFQLDRPSLALMNALLAPPDADPSNADAFGCAVLGETLRNDQGYLEPLGGMESFIHYDAVREPWLACSGDEYKHPGMDSAEQVELATRAVVAFFDAHLGSTAQARQDGCSYLLHELPRDPAISIE